MSAGENELSLSEMRMLTSSVVHMDVRQIALCVITIPRLKSAILELMQSYAAPPPTPPHIPKKKKAKHDPAVVNGQPHRVSFSDCDSEIGSSLLSEPPPLRHKPVAITNSETSEDVTPTVSIPLDAVLAESARGSTEFSMVGDRIAIGKPGKSKAKSEKRVRYITCRVCHLLFYKRDQYRDHMRVHANDPNISVYSCEHCTFVTKRRGVFNTHLLRHTGDLPFKCKMCDYAARQVSLLRQHIHNKHPNYTSDNEVNHHSAPVSPVVKIEGSVCEVQLKDFNEQSTRESYDGILPTNLEDENPRFRLKPST